MANKWLMAIMAAQHETFQPTLTPQQQQMQNKLQGLSGQQFDHEYIQDQVTVHEKTVPIFQKEARDGQNPMIKNYAQTLVPVLQEHLYEAKALAGQVGIAAEGVGTSERSGSSTQR